MESPYPDVLFGEEFRRKVRHSQVLLVGAGGIGSEVLKTLVLTGFRHITVVDLDVIETSNLNRQFLFRSEHVGRSKSEVAAATVEQFLPCPSEDSSISAHTSKKQCSGLFNRNACTSSGTNKRNILRHDKPLSITHHHANIKDSVFNIDFFKRFDLVLNGLDNLDARRHVNRICFAADVPLVESGTAGYEGSVTVHVKDHSHCYECEEKAVQKSFPICTIRNTPEKLIHCVVWAKDLLFGRLFGKPDTVSDLDEVSGADQGIKANGDSQSFFLKRHNEVVQDYAIRVFRRVFDDDIMHVLQMKDLWTNRTPPVSIELSFQQGLEDLGAQKVTDVYKVLSESESVAMFLHSVYTMHNDRAAEIGDLVFDKDDEVAVQFVTAAANLRAQCYSISPSSIFEIKGMAGNIIHAIATTNAAVAGLIVTEACKILSGHKRAIRESFIGKHSLLGSHTRKRDILVKSMLPPPKNPKCVTCGQCLLHLSINTERVTLEELLNKVIRGRLAVDVPNLVSGGFFYEEGEGLDEDEEEEYRGLLSRTMVDLPGGGLAHGAILSVCSQAQHFRCNISISHKDVFDEDAFPEGFALTGSLQEAVCEEDDATAKGLSKRKRRDSTSEFVLHDEEEVEELIVLSDGTNDEETGAAVYSAKKKRYEKPPTD